LESGKLWKGLARAKRFKRSGAKGSKKVMKGRSDVGEYLSGKNAKR
jgi:hypothetical protein